MDYIGCRTPPSGDPKGVHVVVRRAPPISPTGLDPPSFRLRDGFLRQLCEFELDLWPTPTLSRTIIINRRAKNNGLGSLHFEVTHPMDSLGSWLRDPARTLVGSDFLNSTSFNVKRNVHPRA